MAILVLVNFLLCAENHDHFFTWNAETQVLTTLPHILMQENFWPKDIKVRKNGATETRSCATMSLTIFDLTNVSDKQITDWYLYRFSTTYCGKLMFMFNLWLQSSKLFLLPPIIECRYQDDDNNCSQDGDAFNPTSLWLGFINSTCCDVIISNRKQLSP